MTKNLRLKIYRMAADITQQHLADMVGTSRITVCRWETGRAQPSPEMRQRVADVLAVRSWEIWDS